MIKALIVDDEYLVRLGLRKTIAWERLGIEIVGEAEDGQTGLEEALKHRPEIIITDIKMPFLDGIEMMKQVKDSRLDVSFIVLSGYGDFEYAKGAIRYGAAEYLLKPVENDKLEEVLERVVGRIAGERTVARLGKEKVYANLVAVLKTVRMRKTKSASPLIDQAVAYIHGHYAEELSIAAIAEQLHISPSYLMHLFKEDMHCTVVDYVTEYRIGQAKRFLKERTYKIYEVSAMVGYQDHRYFGQLFKKATGLTPREFVKSTLYE
ncbi:response regulator transcription factor [Paenibacillus spongiae]|uniref:Response regulator n=1 Tax=Paenibacillus spongiae TaxID=2909671 RepID=A0ABY5S7R6_9BACL|nr:response regulator [Paenibacillus spongiae]UVI29749.1 response regulator [Paenibacillus spongiae]